MKTLLTLSIVMMLCHGVKPCWSFNPNGVQEWDQLSDDALAIFDQIAGGSANSGPLGRRKRSVGHARQFDTAPQLPRLLRAVRKAASAVARARKSEHLD